MNNWYETYSEQYKFRIVSGKLSTKRIMAMTNLDEEKARELASFCRRGVVPGSETAQPTEDQCEDDHDGAEFLSEQNYVYNPSNDTYVTFLPNVPKPLVLSGSTHRQIIQVYSNFAGTPASVNQLARTFRLPRPWVVKYLRVHGITHDKEPFSDEELLERDDASLVEDALQLRRAAVYRKIEKAKWADTEADAFKWRSVHEHILQTLSGIPSASPSVSKLNLGKTDCTYAGVVGLSDFHWGKYSDAKENFEGFDRSVAKKRLFQSTENALAKLAKFGGPNKLIIPIGSDFFHIDNDLGTTTRGTHQDTDGTPQEILESGCRLMEEWIDCLRQVAPLKLVLMSGNHDRLLGFALLMYLKARFGNTKDVDVGSVRTPRLYEVFGNNLIGFVHGDAVSKTQDLAGLMAQEASSDWGRCPHKTIYTGHLHNEKTETDTTYGVTRRQLPSLAGTDRWHALNGYVGTPKAMPVYLHDYTEGLSAVVYGNPN